jgi:hypothetical protein
MATAKKTAYKTDNLSEEELAEVAKKINELHAKRQKATKTAMAFKSAASRLKNQSEKKTKTPIAKPQEMFSMPQEVKEWIERASSTMKHQANQIATMKEEIAQLKAYKKFASNKIQGMSFE